MKKYILLFATILLAFLNTHAQVTIGSSNIPLSSALLQLKERESTPVDLTTADKGFSFPRVALTKINELYPMYASGYPDISDVDAEKQINTGLVVYNVTTNELVDATTDAFVQGLYVWNGTRWNLLPSSQVVEAQITDLICNSATLTPGSYTAGVPYTGVLEIPYSGGNGGFYDAAPPIIVNGLQFTRQAGQLSIGNGQVYYTVTGTPTITSPEMVNVAITFLGISCTASVGNMQEIKTISFAKNTADNITTANVDSKTVTSLGNLSVRVEYLQYSGFPANFSYYLAYKVGVPNHVTVLFSKSGRSVGYVVSGRKAAQDINLWYRLKTGAYNDNNLILDESATAGPNGNKDDLNPENRDIVEAIFMLHNTNEVYRVTINSNGSIAANGTIAPVTPTITIFLEKLD